MRFHRGDIIWHDGNNYMCEISDARIAIFAPWSIQIDKDGDEFERVRYTDMFAISNQEDDNFEYVIVR